MTKKREITLVFSVQKLCMDVLESSSLHVLYVYPYMTMKTPENLVSKLNYL